MRVDGLALDLQDLAKTYPNGVQALQGVSLTVPRGEIFGLLGQNGAGKSTLVKCLLSIVRPTRCQGSLLGEAIGHRATFRRVGYLPEHVRFPDYLTGSQLLEYVAGLAQVPRRQAKVRAGEMLELVSMGRWGRTKLASYSKGMKQRIGLAQALINDPDLCFLDEPTDGVDPVGRKEIRDLLLGLRARGKTIFVNSHLLGELEMMCDRVVILVKGKVAQAGSVAELTRRSRRYEIRLANLVEPRVIEALGTVLPPNLAVERVSEDTLCLLSDEARLIQPAIDFLRAQGLVIVAVQPVKLSLEDLFMASLQESAH